MEVRCRRVLPLDDHYRDSVSPIDADPVLLHGGHNTLP